MDNFICPRCLGFIPSNETPGAYVGALSRVDNKTEICSECGIEEAMNNFMWQPLPSKDAWPINSARAANSHLTTENN